MAIAERAQVAVMLVVMAALGAAGPAGSSNLVGGEAYGGAGATRGGQAAAAGGLEPHRLRRGLTAELQTYPVEVIQDFLEHSVQLCTGNPLEEWERDILSDALGSSGARQYSRPIQGEEGGITVVMELPKNALDAFEALLGSRSFKLRPCLARQIAGDPPPEAQRMQVAYDLLYSTLIDCSARGLTKEQEDALWRLIDLKDLVISAEELPGGGVGISLQVKLELLHATAGLAAASPAGVAPLRVCMRNVLTGGVAEADGVPLMAEKLLDAQLFYCTDDMTGEDLLGDAWWDLMYKTTAVSQSTEYSDGVGGATGSGSVRYTASFPIQWLRQEMAPLAYPGKSSGQTKLVDCMIQDVALFDPNPEEDLTIAIDLAHAECLNVEDGMSTRQYDRVLRALRLHHNVTTGSAITDRQLEEGELPSQTLEIWLEASVLSLKEAAGVIAPGDQDLAMWLEKCYQIVLSGQRHFMLTSLEWAVLDWVVPRCLPPSADLTSSSLTLEETLRPRLFYTNATHLVSRVEIPKSSLDEASIRLLGGSDSGLLDSIPPCAVEALRGNVNRALVSSSPVAEAVLATVARHCAGVELAILKWESVAKELENVPGFGIRAFVDGELMTGNELPEWWDANNVTFAIDIPSAVVIRIAALLGWEVPVEDALASANDCLLANVASLGAHQMVPPTDTGLKAPAAAKLEETMPVQAHSADDKKGEAGDYQDHNSWVIWVVVGMVLVCVAVVAVAVGIIRKLGKRKEADARRVEEGFSHLHDVSAKPLASYRAAPAAVSQEMAISSMWDFMSTRSTGNSNCSYPGRSSRPFHSPPVGVGGSTVERRLNRQCAELQALSPDFNIDFARELQPFMVQKIGEGAYGVVYRAMWRGRPVAVKVLRSETFQGNNGAAQMKSFIKEVHIMMRYRHEVGIVQMLGACLRRPHVVIVYELMTCNLHDRIHSPALPRLTKRQTMKILLQVAEGLSSLHPRVVHRDLKPPNILLDAAGNAKLADFGLSRQLVGTMMTASATKSIAGTPLYMAPELFDGARPSTEADIYALGVIMNEALSQERPFAAKEFQHTLQVIYTVSVSNARPDLVREGDCPEELRDLIRRCWDKIPAERPSIEEVKTVLQGVSSYWSDSEESVGSLKGYP